MADIVAPNGFGSQQAAEKTPFEKQRDVLIGQITQVNLAAIQILRGLIFCKSMEQIITNMNLLNRSIEGVIAV